MATKKKLKGQKGSSATYLQMQKEEMAHFTVGATDINGYTITKIFGRGDEYVVYEIETRDAVDSLRVFIKTRIETDNEPINNYNQVRVKFSTVKGLLYKVADQVSVKTVMSYILINGIHGKTEESNAEFDKLIELINADYTERFNNRMRFLFSAFVFTLMLVIVAAYTYCVHGFATHIYFRYLIYVIAAGSVGGFLSVSIGVTDLLPEKDVKPWLYLLYGPSRIIFAATAAVILYFAVCSGLVFTIFKNTSPPAVGYITFAILAGFSETLIPNLLKKLENSQTEKLNVKNKGKAFYESIRH